MVSLKEMNERLYKIIGVCLEVHKTMGPGYPVEFYRKALEFELATKDFKFEVRKTLQIEYKDIVVGTVELDFLIDDSVVMMLRSADRLMDVEVQQILRILDMLKKPVGLLMNFGIAKIQYKRIMPNLHQREIKREAQRPLGYRDIGKTREGNPIM